MQILYAIWSLTVKAGGGGKRRYNNLRIELNEVSIFAEEVVKMTIEKVFIVHHKLQARLKSLTIACPRYMEGGAYSMLECKISGEVRFVSPADTEQPFRSEITGTINVFMNEGEEAVNTWSANGKIVCAFWEWYFRAEHEKSSLKVRVYSEPWRFEILEGEKTKQHAGSKIEIDKIKEVVNHRIEVELSNGKEFSGRLNYFGESGDNHEPYIVMDIGYNTISVKCADIKCAWLISNKSGGG